MQVFLKPVIRLTFGLVIVTLLIGCGVPGMDYYNKGVIFQQGGQLDLAEEQYKNALRKNPEFAEAYYNLGVIYGGKGKIDEAEASFKKSIEIIERTRKTNVEGSTWQQELSVAYNNLGAVEIRRAQLALSIFDLASGKSYYDNALAHFKKAVELDPSDTMAQTALQKYKPDEDLQESVPSTQPPVSKRNVDIENKVLEYFRKENPNSEIKLNELSFEYVDLNKDGIDEVIVVVKNTAFIGSGGYTILGFTTQPFKLILDAFGGSPKILTSSTDGYLDIRIEGKTSPQFWKWNRVKQEYE